MPDLININEFAELARCSRSKMCMIRNDGRIPFCRVAKKGSRSRSFYDRREAEQWIRLYNPKDIVPMGRSRTEKSTRKPNCIKDVVDDFYRPSTTYVIDIRDTLDNGMAQRFIRAKGLDYSQVCRG